LGGFAHMTAVPFVFAPYWIPTMPNVENVAALEYVVGAPRTSWWQSAHILPVGLVVV
jgi:hypothetical protein